MHNAPLLIQSLICAVSQTRFVPVQPDQLKEDVGADEYTLYEAIGADYIANQAKGMDRGSAWDAAVKVEATKRGSTSTKILSKTNSIGRAHNKAIKSCSK